LEAEVEGEIRQAVERAEARMDGDPLTMFAHVYAELSPELREQRDELARSLSESSDT
jgi:TPP-dependent pyruvate/acetoin dehydrogenase alpha subunit